MTRYTLAIVDDETFSLEQMTELIDWEKYGFNVITFDDANEFLDYFYQNKVDAVLSDINMPSINGFELIKIVKKENKDIYIAFLSGYADFSYAQEAIRLSAKDYLLKPITYEHITSFAEKMKNALDETSKEWRIKFFQNNLSIFNDYISRKSDIAKIDAYFIQNEIPIDINASPCVLITMDYKISNIENIAIIYLELYNYCIKKHVFCAPLKFLETRLTIGLLFYDSKISENHFYAKEFVDRFKEHFSNKFNTKIDFINLFFLSSLSNLINEYSDENVIDISFSPVNEMKKIIADKYNTDISLDIISDMLGMNSSYLSRIFRNETGIKYIDYLNNVRIEHSKVLLLNTNQNINTISKNVGYHSRNHFGETFKKITGTTPQEYRNQKLIK